MTQRIITATAALLLFAVNLTAQPQVLWNVFDSTHVFASVDISDEDFGFAGLRSSDIGFARQYQIAGDGSPAFSMGDSLTLRWTVAAAPTGDVWAAVGGYPDSSTAIYLLSVEGPDTLWQYDLNGLYPYGFDALQFTSDGQKLAVWLNNGMQPRLLVWDLSGEEPALHLDYQATNGAAWAMAISESGQIIAVTAGLHCHVLDLTTQSVRDVIELNSSQGALDISSDGSRIVTAYANIRVHYWNGQSYSGLWLQSFSGDVCTQALISPDNSYIATCWRHQWFTQNKIRVLDLSSGDMIWGYDYQESTEGIDDYPIALDMSDDGSVFAVGSLGNDRAGYPQVHVFTRWESAPYYTLEIPGSCLDVSLSPDGSYLLAGGTHEHASFNPPMGDLYMIDLDLELDADVVSVVPSSLDLSVFPNPFNASTAIEFDIPPGSREFEVHVFNSLGQLVQSENLSGQGARMRYALNGSGWSSGMYFVTVDAGVMQGREKVVLLK